MWIEDYLKSVDENELRRIYLKMRKKLNPNYIKLIHSPIEFGRDIIELVGDQLNMYQAKAGDIDTKKWDNEVEPQIKKMFTVRLDDPNVNENEIQKKGFILLNGQINIYADKPVSSIIEYYKNHFGWDISIIDLTGLVKEVNDNEMEDLLFEEELWYEYQTIVAKIKKRISDVNSLDSFIIDLLQTSKHYGHLSFKNWFINDLIARLDAFINSSKLEEEKDYYKFYKFCVLEISIALFGFTDNLKEYFKISEYGDVVVISNQILGPIPKVFKEHYRIFGMKNLINGAKGYYKYTNDANILDHVNEAFKDLWYSTGNPGRNRDADIEELNTIDTFSALLLLLFEKKKNDIAKVWLIKIGDYLLEANKIAALTEGTSFANFSFLEYILLFDFQDLFEKYKSLFSNDLMYLYNDQRVKVVFENSHDYISILTQYKALWDNGFLENNSKKEKVITIIKVAYSYRFQRDPGAGIEDIQKLLRYEIIKKRSQ